MTAPLSASLSRVDGVRIRTTYLSAFRKGYSMRISTRRLSALLLAAITALTLGACGDDAGDDEADATTTTEAAAATVEVTAVDYGYQGLPDSVEAGTRFTLANTSTAELHEFVAMRIPDEETRSIEELVGLSEEEQRTVFSGEPATVLVTPPGGEMIQALGDGTIDEAGRYAVACFIPTGADPQEFLQAMQESEGGPPDVEGGPPHVTKGMYAELTVTDA